ncbi:hypothetical protein CERSUDRAFT_84190 [Gelatoporia subvermispora B]|uniref:Uncharacterized protein n=1 Tax=Ceriporiopsis subvermispora (strain B) TaxID=914234 RepID=M2QYC0_CERS8|nr:hypothetical protein CERSUDRAFT_84190 [Gelatoporia subvermispora B]
MPLNGINVTDSNCNRTTARDATCAQSITGSISRSYAEVDSTSCKFSLCNSDGVS